MQRFGNGTFSSLKNELQGQNFLFYYVLAVSAGIEAKKKKKKLEQSLVSSNNTDEYGWLLSSVATLHAVYMF